MVVRRIFDPGRLLHIAGFFPEKCTIEEPVFVTMPGGEKHVSGYVPFAGHADLACAVGRPGGGEQKLREATPTITSHRISLRGYYPTIKREMRAVVGGRSYDILAVEHDQHLTQTYLGCEVAEL